MKTPHIKEVHPIIKASKAHQSYDINNRSDRVKLLKLLTERAFLKTEKGGLIYKTDYHRNRTALFLGNLLNYKYYISFDTIILFSNDLELFELYWIAEVKQILEYEYNKLLTDLAIWGII